MKKLLTPFLILLATVAHAQSIQTVDVHANGTDIRDVLYQLFTQAKKSYVLQPGIHEALNLNLVNVEFDEALQIVCEAANLRSDLQNGIYYLGRKKAARQPASEGTMAITKPVAKLDAKVLDRKVSTKLAKAPIKQVLAELSRQTHVVIEIDPAIPSYRLDAFLNKLTLRQALDRITKATKLAYTLTDRRSIRVTPNQAAGEMPPKDLEQN